MVLNEAFRLLGTNNVVEVLYCQNLEDGMTDDTLGTLIDVLKKGRIWALNVGENYRITNAGWRALAEALPTTNVTHMYVSEHIITPEMKTRMMSAIRANRISDRRHRV